MTIQTNGDDCRESGEGETSRQQFEAWIERISISQLDAEAGLRECFINMLYHAWVASRADIEITMPPRVITTEIGPAVSLEKMMARLAVNGIKVKPHEQRNPPQT